MIAFYRLLLHLYPASFRAEYGDELCAAFAESARQSSRARALVNAIVDVTWNAIGAHFDILTQDLRYAVRTLRHSTGFAFTAIVIVALGIGANTAAFSLADFVLLRPLPFPHSDRLIQIWGATNGYQNEVTPPNYEDWRRMSTNTISGMAAYAFGAANLVGVGAPRRVQLSQVTPELMPLIGVGPRLGSIITQSNAKLPVVVLSHDLWRTQFASDAGVIGRVIRLDGAPYTVVGVMPPAYRFPSRESEAWIPLMSDPQDWADRTNSFLKVVARLKPGATLEGARAELGGVAARLQQQYPEENQDLGVTVIRLRDQMGQRSKLLVIALFGASLCILLLACANLASLLLARAANRAREIAIRTALGCGRERLVRQLVTETILLAVIGGSLGVFIAWAGLPLLAQLVPMSLPVEEVPKISPRVIGFAAALMALTGLGFGIVPALRTQKTTGRQRLRGALVVLEVVGSVVLLISSGLLMRAISRIQSIEPGFHTDEVMSMRTALPMPKYGTVASRQHFYDRVLADVRAIPGVKSAAYTTGLPMVRTGGLRKVELPGADPHNNLASLRYVTSDYFATLGIPLLRGRDVAGTDTQQSLKVAVVSESLARRHWPNQEAIGRTFKFSQKERTIVGIVGDVRTRGFEQASEPQVYIPAPQVDDNEALGYVPIALVVRSSLPAAQWMPEVRRIVAAADPEQPISDVRPLSDVVADTTAPRRVQLRVLTILSAIALLIAAVGIHGLLSFAVAQRTRELGIRHALGAQASEIVGIVLREGLTLALVGTAIGVAVAIAVARTMRALLFGIAPTDTPTIVAAVALCFITAVIGCLRPAIRAARVDPIIALREG